MMPARNLASVTATDDDWDPSKSEDKMMLSRSSKMTTEGAWSKASDMLLESA